MTVKDCVVLVLNIENLYLRRKSAYKLLAFTDLESKSSKPLKNTALLPPRDKPQIRPLLRKSTYIYLTLCISVKFDVWEETITAMRLEPQQNRKNKQTNVIEMTI